MRRKNNGKFLPALVFACMVMSMTSVTAKAENVVYAETAASDTAISGDYEYQFIEGTNNIEITGYTGTDTELVIPDTINGYQVTSIGDFVFSGCSRLENISLPEGLTRIGNGAFEDCSSLTSISVPEGVTILGYIAFNGCSNLTSISVPKGLIAIGAGAFYGCNNLTIYGYRDSVMQDYAARQNIPFVVLEEEPDNPTVRNGLALAEDGNWYYYGNGVVDTSYTGMALNEYGWWYVTNGALDWSYTGMALNEYGWWYMTNGALDWNYTGMALNEHGWWYMTNGALDWSYTGMALNEYGWWYMTNGALDLTYTGTALNEYGQWQFVNGQLVW